MDSPQLALLALLAGALIAGGIGAVIIMALRARDRVRAQASGDVPDGVAAVLAGMDDAAIVVDPSSTVIAASVPAEGFGMQVGEVLASDELRQLARVARDGGSQNTATLRLRRGAPPAEPRLVATRATRITPRLVLVVVRDITERERVEQMRHDFVSNTSHELKTPVGAVSLLAEAIESAADDPEQVRIFAVRLMAEAARLARLTARIMNLSRLQAADELSEVREVSVDEVVTSAIEAHVIQADSAGVTLVRGGERGLYVRGDAQVLSEAVGNLIANAVAYSPKGANVGVGLKLNAGLVEISVTDRGIGIREADQHRIFERFYRADEARSRRTGGTGLGLSIVKHAVQRHGGEVRLWSRPGRGSTFTVVLPSVAPPEIPIKPKRKRKAAAGGPKAPKTPKPVKKTTTTKPSTAAGVAPEASAVVVNGDPE